MTGQVPLAASASRAPWFCFLASPGLTNISPPTGKLHFAAQGHWRAGEESLFPRASTPLKERWLCSLPWLWLGSSPLVSVSGGGGAVPAGELPSDQMFAYRIVGQLALG